MASVWSRNDHMELWTLSFHYFLLKVESGKNHLYHPNMKICWHLTFFMWYHQLTDIIRKAPCLMESLVFPIPTYNWSSPDCLTIGWMGEHHNHHSDIWQTRIDEPREQLSQVLGWSAWVYLAGNPFVLHIMPYRICSADPWNDTMHIADECFTSKHSINSPSGYILWMTWAH